MDRMEAEDLSLFGLLGRSWQLDAPIADLVFDQSDGAVAFALADGSVAIAKIKDREPASGRIRVSVEDGRSSILPRSKPLPPIVRLSVQNDLPVALTAYGKHGFVIGDSSGALTSLTPGGERTPFARPLNAPITTLAHAVATGDLACATADRKVVLIRRGQPEPARLEVEGSIGALAFSPDGNQLAVACEGSVTLWDTAKHLEKRRELTPCEQPASLAWSPDQSALALGQQKGGIRIWRLDGTDAISLADYPAPVRSLAWSASGEQLVTGGAFRIIVWPLDQWHGNGLHPTSLTTGRPGLATVEAVAAHPAHPLTAAGYENGMLIVAQVGRPDELVIRAEGRGAIDKIAWSTNAGFIAIGSDQGLASIVELPQQLFK
ncbi:MAG: WD40 repeat domain-containing protein [Alphaproteobacteria bacterium]